MLNSVPFCRLTLFSITLGLFACSSGGNGNSGSSGTAAETFVAPVFTSVVSGDELVELSWNYAGEPGTDGTDGDPIQLYSLYYANATEAGISIADLAETYTTVEEIEAIEGVRSIEEFDATSRTIRDLQNLNLYYFILTAHTAECIEDEDDDDEICSEDEIVWTEGPASALEAFAMPRASLEPGLQPLNDTGYTLCADYTYGIDAQDTNDDGLSFSDIDGDNDGVYYEHDNRIDCATVELDTDLGVNVDSDTDPVPSLTQQDSGQGLDATSTDDDGIAGFSFTKLDENGNSLANPDDPWSCVQDNVTGLVWEAKTSSVDDMHYSKDRFTWYNDDTTLNGENSGNLGGNTCSGYDAGDESTYCNTQAFVSRVNEEMLCGFDDWRLPDLIELRSILNYGTANEQPRDIVASVDLEYFPNTEIDGGLEGTTIDGGVRYWASETYALSSSFAWSMYFGYGGAPVLSKSTLNTVRLVRGEP